MIKKIFNKISIRIFGLPIYIWLILFGFTLNTINYSLAYPFSEIYGWVLKMVGMLFFIYSLIN